MREREIEGIKEAARFAIQPNMWGYCGENTSQEVLRKYLKGEEHDPDKVREILANHGFPHLNAFLGALAEANGTDVFDEEIVNAYWFGGNVIDNAGLEVTKLLVINYAKQIGRDFAGQLAVTLPEKVYLTHLSQVAMVAANGETEPMKNAFINRCMIARAKVLEIDNDKRTALVARELLKKRVNEPGYDVMTARQKVKLDLDLTPNLEVGDQVALHLEYVASKLSPNEAVNLSVWTRKVADIL